MAALSAIPAEAEPARSGPDVERAHRLWGETLVAVEADDPDRTRSLAEELVDVERRSRQPDALRLAESLRLLGAARSRVGDLEGALRSLGEADRIYAGELGIRNPLSADALGAAAEVYVRLGDLHRARLAMDRAVELLPPFEADRALRCAWVYESSGAQAAARECAERALKLDRESPAVLNNLAWLVVSAERASPGELERAERLARQALGRAPTSSAIADTLGVILIRRGSAAEAVEVFRDILAGDRGPIGSRPEVEGLIRFHAALAHEAAGDAPRAAELARQARELAGDRLDPDELRRLELRLVAHLPEHSGVLRDP
jgi:tetratricopeptide (TPR) repeat protein